MLFVKSYYHFLRYAEKLYYSLFPDKSYLSAKFKRKFGYRMNFDSPRTLNEKIQWLKLNNMSDIHIKCADKYAVRTFVKNTIGEEYLIPMFLSTRNLDDIDELPDEPCIIKTNNGSSSNGSTIVWDKKNFNFRRIAVYTTKWLILNRNKWLYGREMQYKHIEPQVIIEKLLTKTEGNIPEDYKFHCMNGEIACIQVDFDRFNSHKRSFYDINWNYMEFQWGFEMGGDIVERPENLDEMMSLARKLSSEFKYVRVDFYSVGGKISFGELTFTPGSGFVKIKPFEWDEKLGDMLDLTISEY